mmetsp:Transcript_14612/g.27422  ORF Transcript_14612/g.27422 Transcript_14612/m.27422 type:complete len:186 (-) Transcript_14612:227-784(-)
MGIGFSGVDLTVPQGGHTMILQDPQACFPTVPQVTEAMTRKPVCLSMLDDSTWKSWHKDLATIVDSYYSELLTFIFLPLSFVGIICGFAFSYDLPVWAMPALVLPGILLSFVCRFFICSKNESRDQEIHQLCANISKKSGGAVRVEYRTAWTGFCKPKHARTARIIAFVPLGAAVVKGQVVGVGP